MTFNEKLKELRLKNGWSQEQFSRKLNIATRTYTYYEKGEKYPSVEVLIQMSKLLNVGICYLLDEQDAQSQGCKCDMIGAKQLIKELGNLFASSELSEAEKDAIMKSLHDAYQSAKNDNKK